MPDLHEFPFYSSQGTEYVIRFSLSEGDLPLPESLTVPVYTLDLVLINKHSTLSFKDFCQISKIIENFLHENDIIIFYYCDDKPIKRSKKNSFLTNQEYRSLLFGKMFNRAANTSYLKKDFKIDDNINGDHYISMISSKKNHLEIARIESNFKKEFAK